MQVESVVRPDPQFDAKVEELGDSNIALPGGGGGGGGVARTPAEGGGGVSELGFRAGPFVLCKDGCCPQRRRDTNFGPKSFFHQNFPPPHMCGQNDQRDVGIILSHICLG